MMAATAALCAVFLARHATPGACMRQRQALADATALPPAQRACRKTSLAAGMLPSSAKMQPMPLAALMQPAGAGQGRGVEVAVGASGAVSCACSAAQAAGRRRSSSGAIPQGRKTRQKAHPRPSPVRGGTAPWRGCSAAPRAPCPCRSSCGAAWVGVQGAWPCKAGSAEMAAAAGGLAAGAGACAENASSSMRQGRSSGSAPRGGRGVGVQVGQGQLAKGLGPPALLTL